MSSEAAARVPAFGDRLASAFAEHGQLCVGIDPHEYLLGSWGLSEDASGLREFGLRVVEAAAGRVGIVKPQVAFFERFGAAGYAALEETIAAARAAGLLVIADAKRGDVGSTVDAYARAWLSPGSPLEADAMTIGVFQGLGSIAGPISLAHEHGKGLFVLAATSNPEARALQTAVIEHGEQRGRTVAAGIVRDVVSVNSTMGVAEIGSVGLVLGATLDFADYGIPLDEIGSNVATPVLAPGFGHQGARFDQVTDRYGSAAAVTIVNVSRSVLGGGAAGLAAGIDEQARELARCLG